MSQLLPSKLSLLDLEGSRVVLLYLQVPYIQSHLTLKVFKRTWAFTEHIHIFFLAIIPQIIQYNDYLHINDIILYIISYIEMFCIM